MRLLLSPDPSDAGNGGPEIPPTPSHAPEPALAPPPAAQTVLAGDKTEETANLKAELEAERAARRKAELDAAQAQDELHRITTPPKSVTAPGTVRSRIFSFGRE